jgi:hypothetical protein
MKVLFVISHVSILAVGFAAGVFSPIARVLREGLLMTSQGVAIAHYATLVDIQRNEGDQDAYRKSLIAFLGVLNDVAKHPSEFFDSKTTSIDMMLTYERLSTLEKEAGNSEASDAYMKLALTTCGRTGWKDCSIARIQRISRKMEESSLIRPTEAKGSTSTR